MDSAVEASSHNHFICERPTQSKSVESVFKYLHYVEVQQAIYNILDAETYILKVSYITITKMSYF